MIKSAGDSHIIITGPGRSGTSFIMQLLTRMGCDTGFRPYDEPFNQDIRAGCEWQVDINPDHPKEEIVKYMAAVPYIFKAPDWSWKLKGFLALGLVKIDHVILPFRDFDISAKSRLDAGIPWMVSDAIEDDDERLSVQAAANAAMFGRAIEACYLFNIPCIIMRYPELIHSADYCYQRLNRIFETFNYDLFKKKHTELSWGRAGD